MKSVVNPSEMVIRTLYAITSDYKKGFDEQVRRILALGCKRFDLEVGQMFELASTYCCVTLNAQGPVGFEHCSESEMASHPAYLAFQLEAYVGTPVMVDGEVYGTLNFSSPAPRPREFDAADLDALQLMATWVSAEIHRRRTEDALRAATTELQRLTQIDPLTELLNRRGVEVTLARIAARIEGGGPPCSTLLVDLDDFKMINDRHGHDAGDRVIAQVARTIGWAVRPTDVVGRIGGDEFLVLLPGCNVVDAGAIAERIRGAVASSGSVTATIGIAAIAGHTTTVTDLLAGVTKLLASGKRAGKNQVFTG